MRDSTGSSRVSLGFFIFSYCFIHSLSFFDQQFNYRYVAGGCGHNEEGLGLENEGSGLYCYLEEGKVCGAQAKGGSDRVRLP